MVTQQVRETVRLFLEDVEAAVLNGQEVVYSWQRGVTATAGIDGWGDTDFDGTALLSIAIGKRKPSTDAGAAGQSSAA